MTAAVLSAPGASSSSIAQAPATPWRNETEAEEYAKDPKAYLLKRLDGWAAKSELFTSRVLVATYFAPAFRTLPSGFKFHFTEKSLDESMYQGKVGLVIAKGPMAFVDDERNNFHGQTVDVGDWVYFSRSRGELLAINQIHCRALQDTEIMGRLSDPQAIY